MKLDVTRQLAGLDGTPLERPVGQCSTCGHVTEAEPVTLRGAMTVSLLAQSREQVAGDEKAKRWALAMRIQQEDAPALDLDELALVKRLVGEVQPSLVVGQVWAILEGEGAGG